MKNWKELTLNQSGNKVEAIELFPLPKTMWTDAERNWTRCDRSLRLRDLCTGVERESTASVTFISCLKLLLTNPTHDLQSISVNAPVEVPPIYMGNQSVCRSPSPRPPTIKIYINSTAQRARWCSFTFLIKLNPDIITIMPFLLQLYIIVVHRVQKSTKVWHAKCLKTRLYLVNKHWNFVSVIF